MLCIAVFVNSVKSNEIMSVVVCAKARLIIKSEALNVP